MERFRALAKDIPRAGGTAVVLDYRGVTLG